NVSPSSSAQSKKHDDKTKREAKDKSLVESLTGYRNLSVEFEDFSDNNINEVNVTGTLVIVVGQNSPNSTNTFNATGPSNAVVSPTHGKSSCIDISQLPDDLDMPELEDINYFDDEDDVGAEANFNNLETSIIVSPIPTTRVHKDHPMTQIIGALSSATQTRSMTRVAKYQGGLSKINNEDFHTCMFACFLSQEEPKREEGIDYEEVFAPIARIEAIRLFLAYASFMGFIVYQMDAMSAFLYETIKEEVYVCQPPGFKDPGHPDKVYKVVKALYGLHQAPRSWYETLANYLLKNGFQRGKIDQTLFIKRQKGDILLLHIYVDDIIFGSTYKDLCKAFEKLMKDKFQMSSMGELTFFLGIQVKQKKDGIFISQDKYVAKILRKFRLTDGKSGSTPIDIENPLLKDPDGEDVDVHTYRLMIGSLMNLTSSRPNIMFVVCACARFQVTPKASHLPAVKRIFRYLKGKPHLGLWYPKDSPFDLVAYSDSDYAGTSLDRKSTIGGCQFLGCRLISWQSKKQTVVATSSTEAEYVAAARCCAQIIDFLNGSSIKYALTVNPNIYVSYIKQFWTTVAVKKVNDVTRLQALVNKKKVVVTEATIRDVLRLDNAEGVECLPNEEIFVELTRMGYEKPSTKLTFYKAFFSIQKQVGDLSTHTTKYTSPALTQKVFANIRRVGKGFSGVETPLFGGMIVEQQVAREVDANENVEGVNASDATKGDVSAANDEVPTTDEEPSIPSPTPSTPPPQPSQYIPSTSLVQPTPPQSPQLKQRVKKLERRNKVKVLKLRRLQKVGTGQRIETSDDTVMDDVSNQRRMIAEIDQDADVVLEEIKDVVDDIVKDDQDVDVEESAHDQGREAESQAEIYKIDLEHANKVLSMPEDECKPAEVQEVVDVVTTAKIIAEVVTTASITITAADVQVPVVATAAASTFIIAPSRRRKGVVIREPEESTITMVCA
nr:putative ribonuclease H-like domain-containing protein [Tanacetum cinerariifolium]